jgi:hypothetical protein
MRVRWAFVGLGAVAALGAASCGSSAKPSVGTTPPTTKPATASECTPGPGLTKTALTASYTMVLDVNPTEAMYTPAQVAAQHPTTGEVMLQGQMNDMTGTGTSGSSPTTMMGSATTMTTSAANTPTHATMGSSPMTTTSTSPMGQSPMTTATTAMGHPSSSDMAGANARHLEVHICARSTGKVVQNAPPKITVVDHASGGMTDHVSVAEMEGIGAGVADLHYGNNITMPAMHRYTVTVVLNGERAVFDLTRPT